MQISIPGVLERAADRLAKTRDGKYLEWPLRQLSTHLKELATKPDAETLAEFFQAWVYEGVKRAESTEAK